MTTFSQKSAREGIKFRMEALKAEPVSSRLSSQKESAGDDELSRDVTTDTGGPLDISESETLHRDSPDSDATDADPISPSVIHLQPGFSLVANSVVIIRSDYSHCKPQTYTYHFSIVNNTSEPIKLNYQPILHPFQEDTPQSSEALIPDNSHYSESSSDLPLPKFTQCTGPDSQSEKAVKTEPIDYSITMNESGTEMESSHEMGEYPIRGQESDCDDDDDDMESDTEDLQGQNSNPYGGLPSTSFQSQVAVGYTCRMQEPKMLRGESMTRNEFGHESTTGATHSMTNIQGDYPELLTSDGTTTMAEERINRCKICGETFKELSELIDHAVHMHKKRFKCEFCNKYLTTRTVLKKHMRSHTNERPFTCEVCFKTFTDRSILRCHERSHTEDRPFKCKYPNCDKTYKYWVGLNNHMERIHIKKRDQLCDLCGMIFVCKSSLHSHMRTHQPKTEKPYHCEYCPKVFRTSKSRVLHTRTHTGEKPFKCRHCGKTFVSRSQQATHERIHTGEKPYKCDYCKKAFRQKGVCKQHMNIHTGERPFKCSQCDKAFAAQATLRNHLRTHRDGKGCLKTEEQEDT